MSVFSQMLGEVRVALGAYLGDDNEK